MSDVQDFVVENRRRIRRNQSRFQEFDALQTRDLSLGRSFIDVAVDVRVERRTTGTQVIFGHPDETKGFGRGTFGDDRGEWETVAETSKSAALLQSGRSIVATSLSDVDTGPYVVRLGYDGEDAATSDGGLFTPADATAYVPEEVTPGGVGTISIRSAFDTEDVAADGTARDFEAIADGDQPIARVTATVDVENTDDLRVTVDMTFSADGIGTSTFTDAAPESLRDTFASSIDANAFAEWVISTSADQIDPSDTALTPASGRADATSTAEGSGVRPVAEFDETKIDDPLPLVIESAGLYDEAGSLVWGVVTRPLPVDADTEFITEADFNVL